MHGTNLPVFARVAIALGALSMIGCPRGGGDAPPVVGGGPEAPSDEEAPPEEPTGEPGEEICVQGLVVSWKGAVDAPPTVERSQTEAEARAAALYLRIEQDGKSFSSMARESDLFADRDLLIGVFPVNRWPAKHAAIKDAIRDLNVHMHAPVIETAYGYVIPRRCMTGQTTFRRLTIAYRGAIGAGPDNELTKEQAFKKAEGLKLILEEEPDLFPILLDRHGDDDEEAKAQGGILGVFTLGNLPEPMNEFGDMMRDLAVSDPVERPEGYAIYQRVPIGYEPKVRPLVQPDTAPGAAPDAPAETGDTPPAADPSTAAGGETAPAE